MPQQSAAALAAQKANSTEGSVAAQKSAAPDTTVTSSDALCPTLSYLIWAELVQDSE